MPCYASFSEDCKYYAHVSHDGKLRIWNVASGFLEQEYTPDIHLTSPFTELRWIKVEKVISNRKRKLSVSDNIFDSLIIGTRSGRLLLYSIATGSVVETFDKCHNSSINCITWNKLVPSKFFSSSEDQYVAEWDISSKSVCRKWKCGRTSRITISPDGHSLITANKEIKWWNVSNKDEELVKSYIGHSADVECLTCVSISGTPCVLSVAKSERLIHVWVLSRNENRQASIIFSMDDYIESLSVRTVQSGAAEILASTQSGAVHFYHCVLNGQSKKPLKPELTIQIALENSHNKNDVEKIPIRNVVFSEEQVSSCYIAYGEDAILSFEKLHLETEESTMFLIRQDPRKKMLANKELAGSKLMATNKAKKAQYVHPDTVNGLISVSSKKGQKRHHQQSVEKVQDVPLEVRLENLTSDMSNASIIAPSSESLTHLLLQGLRSKDTHILHEALLNKDDAVIKTTVSRLPLDAVIPFSTELVSLMRGKPTECDAAVRWLKHIVTLHASHLISYPGITDIFGPLFPIIESKLNALSSLYRLSGRLDLMIEQIEHRANNASRIPQNVSLEPQLVYQDEDSDDSDDNSDISINERPPSESDDQWDEVSELDDSGPDEPMQEDAMEDT